MRRDGGRRHAEPLTGKFPGRLGRRNAEHAAAERGHDGAPSAAWALPLAAAAAWGVAAVVAKGGFEVVDPLRLSQLRAAAAAALLLGLTALTARPALRHGGRTLLSLLPLGTSLAVVNATYYLAIERLPVGVAVTIQYTGPLLVLAARPSRARPRHWLGGTGAVAGAALVSGALDRRPLDGAGMALAVASAIAFGTYLVLGERAGRRHGALVATAFGFASASMVWAVVLPWWQFPFAALATAEGLWRSAVVAGVGTALPFLLIVRSMGRVPAGVAGIMASSEPAFAALFAWVLLSESLTATQLAGMALTIVAIAVVQRPEAVPLADAFVPVAGRTRPRLRRRGRGAGP